MQYLPNIKFLCLGEKYRGFPNEEIEVLVKKIENEYNTNKFQLHFTDESIETDTKFRNSYHLYVTRQSLSYLLSRLTDKERYIVFLFDDNYHLEGSHNTPFIQITSINSNAIATVNTNGFNFKCERILLNFLQIKCNRFGLESDNITIHNCVIDGEIDDKTNGSLKMNKCQRICMKKNHLKNIIVETSALSFGKIKRNLMSNCHFRFERSILSMERNVLMNNCNVRVFQCTYVNIDNNSILSFGDKIFNFDYSSNANFSDNTVINTTSSESYKPFFGLFRSSKVKVLHNVFYGVSYVAELDWNCSMKLHQNLFNKQIVEVSSYDSKCTFYSNNKYCSFELQKVSFDYKTGKYDRVNDESHFVHEYPEIQKIKKSDVIENLDAVDKFLVESHFDLEKINGDKIMEINKQMESFEKENHDYEKSAEYEALLRDRKELMKNKITAYSLGKNSLVCVLTTRGIIIPDRTVVSYF